MSVDEIVEVPLHRVAHARTGDKGNRINVSLICYHPEAFALVLEQITAAAVAQCFGHRAPTAVHRYVLPRIAACNFVIDDVLAGGVNQSLCLDRHGKGLSYLLLSMPVRVPRRCVVEY